MSGDVDPDGLIERYADMADDGEPVRAFSDPRIALPCLPRMDEIAGQRASRGPCRKRRVFATPAV